MTRISTNASKLDYIHPRPGIYGNGGGVIPIVLSIPLHRLHPGVKQWLKNIAHRTGLTH